MKVLPATTDFKGEGTSDRFLENKAKWQKSCHLKFSSSKLEKLKKVWRRKGRKREMMKTGDH